jgi:hypothetical protein
MKNLKISMSSTSEVSVVGQRVIKKLNAKQSTVFLEMYRDGTILQLLNHGLISEFEVIESTSNSVEVTQPLLLVFASHELPFSRVAEIGRRTLDLVKLLDKRGYGLIDASLENWAFEGITPKFVDFGSFLKKSSKLQLLFHENEFRSGILGPLELAKRNTHLGGLLLYPGKQDWDFREFKIQKSGGILELLLRLVKKYHLRSIARNLFYSLSKYPFIDGNRVLNEVYSKTTANVYVAILPFFFLIYRIRFSFFERRLRVLASSFTVPMGSYWANYEERNRADLSERFESITEIICSLQPKKLLDVGGNSGYLSRSLSERLPETSFLTLDIDRGALEVGIERTQGERAEFSFGLFDLSNPIESPNLLPLAERFRAGVVVCLALTHHILLQDHLPLEKLVARLRDLTSDYVLVEFMPLGLWSPGQKYIDSPSWYTEEYFKQGFNKEFRQINRVQLEENRILFVLRKRTTGIS